MWMSPYCSTNSAAALVGPAFGSFLEFWWSPLGQATAQCSALLKTIDPFKMAPTSMSNTYCLVWATAKTVATRYIFYFEN